MAQLPSSHVWLLPERAPRNMLVNGSEAGEQGMLSGAGMAWHAKKVQCCDACCPF
jgi:hypothetical protein